MLIVVGGQSRKVGKTSVVAGLIAALPQYQWTAFKISQHGHDAGNQPWVISEEKDRRGTSDTSRFLQSGAIRAWWVRAQPDRLPEAMPAMRARLAETKNAIIESSSVMEFLHPNLYLMVLDPATTDFKKSARQFLALADAVILHETNEPPSRTHGMSLAAVKARPIFLVRSPRYVTSEIVEFVEKRLDP